MNAHSSHPFRGRHIAVLMGGWSAERDISLISGRAVANALRGRGYNHVTEVDADRGFGEKLAALRPDVVFNALHGTWGEDGCVQGVLEILGIPYTHSGVLASAAAMDKDFAKKMFRAEGIRVPEGRIAAREDLFKHHVMAPPYVVKPVAEGSSVGVVIVRPGDAVPAAEMPGPWADHDSLLIERYIPGRELTVAVLGDRPLTVTELRPKSGWYDFKNKYTDGMTDHIVPAPVHPEIAELAMEWALLAHRTLGCRGATRSDFRYDDTAGEPGDLYLLELNTQPGLTPLSLVPEQAAHVGIEFGELVEWMVEDSCAR